MMDITRKEIEQEQELTEAEIKEQEEALKIENKQNYKLISQYIQSDIYKKLCDKFIKKGEKLGKEFNKKLKERKETVTTKSQMDKDDNFRNFLKDVMQSFGDSEVELLLRKTFLEAYESVTSHIENKQEEGYDIPLFTELDLIKQLRIEYLCVGKRIGKIRAGYSTMQDQEIPSSNPY